MNLVYTDATHTTIQATLDAGESLGNMTGPAQIFIPVDPANREYGDVLERKLTIAAYTPPA
jgi:hypothetical protein